MRRSRLISLAVAAVLAVVLVAGCGGDDDDDKAADTQTTEQTTPSGGTPAGENGASKAQTVRMDEYDFEPSDVTIERGGTITVENAGKISHNLTIEEGPDPKEETSELTGTSTFLPPKSEKLTVDVSPGKHALVCTVPGHRQLGMVGSITVK